MVSETKAKQSINIQTNKKIQKRTKPRYSILSGISTTRQVGLKCTCLRIGMISLGMSCNNQRMMENQM